MFRINKGTLQNTILHNKQSRSLSYLCPSKPPTKIPKNTPPYVRPSLGTNPAYDHALNMLESFKQSHKIDEVQAAYADFEKHYNFHFGEYDAKDPVFKSMQKTRWQNHVLPKLLNESKKLGIVGDAFPEPIVPTAQLLVTWPNVSNWLGTYGTCISSTWTVNSPTVRILTEKSGLYSLVMTDLDRPNTSKGCIEEFAHWHILNIPVVGGEELVINGGSSPFIKGQENKVDVPGDVLFDYIPPHPPHSNPKKPHRYLVSLLEQPEKIDAVQLKSKIKEMIGPEIRTREDKVEAAMGNRKYDVLEFRERSAYLPSWKWLVDSGCTLKGYGFFQSSWDLETSDIFQKLGIHEPVYGKISAKNPKIFIERVTQSMKVLDSHSIQTSNEQTIDTQSPLISNIIKSSSSPNPLILSKDPLTQSPVKSSLIDLIRHGKSPVQPVLKQINIPQVEAILSEKTMVKPKNEKKKKGAVGIINSNGVVRDWRVSTKMPKLTSVGVTGLVKSREVDGAAAFVGGISRKVGHVKERYLNV